MIEKWQCHTCEKGWLMLEEDAKNVPEITCPFCKQSDNVEAVAGDNTESNLKNEMGCLWPSYNEFDRLAYLYRKGEITQDQIRERVNSSLSRKG